MHDAVVLYQVIVMSRRTTALGKIDRGGDSDAHDRTKVPLDQGLVRDFAATNGEIEFLLYHVAGMVFHHQFTERPG